VNVSQRIARVYAEALLDLAQDKGDLGRVVDDLHAVRELFDKDPTFRMFFSTHRLERHEKQRILKDALQDKIGRNVLGLLHVLVDKRRELLIDNIVDEFDRFKDIREGIRHAYVTSARPLDEDQTADIRRRLEASTGLQITLHERVDPKLLGGLVVKLGDRIVDGTVRRRLQKLRRAIVHGTE
jgi:F-type H+-transporting ATPase subunit delta